jgi:starch-binding outer membrane protein, SusD/RagB family
MVTATVAILSLVTACSGALDVVLPGKVNAGALDSPSLATTMVASAQGDFECAFSEFVHTTGLWSNELLNSSGGGEVNPWGARLLTYDAGTVTCPTVSSNRGAFSTYLPLQVARGQAEGAIARLDGFTDAQVPTRTSLTATALAYAGYEYTLFGEAYCQMAVDSGPLITPAATLALAEARLTRAIDLATTANNTAILNLARLTRARVRLDLKNLSGADADAKLVPSGFVYNATYALTPFRRSNTVVLNINVNFHESVAPEFRGLTVGTTPDPRVPVVNANRNGQDALTPLWTQQKYKTVDAPIPMATWDEAQLIMAEAEGGQGAVDAINRIRTKYNLPLYAGGTADEISAQIREERRRTLFLDGHSIGDHLRNNIPFATGVNQKGVRYGDLTCLPLPRAETSGR